MATRAQSTTMNKRVKRANGAGANKKEQSSSSKKLLNLPNEILLKICEYLCWHCQCAKPTTQEMAECNEQIKNSIHKPTATLASLTRTCRRLSGIANSTLYHGFSATKLADMYNFLDTIQCRPELARSVKTVFLQHVSLVDNDHNAGNYHRMAQDSMCSLGLENFEIARTHRTLVTRKRLGQYEALSQIILVYLRDLESIHLEIDMETTAFNVFDSLAGTRSRHLSAMKPANVLWPHLRDCTVFPNYLGPARRTSALEGDFGGSMSARTLSACGGLLSLAPRASRLHSRSFMAGPRDMRPLQNITELHLQCGEVFVPAHLEKALRSIRALDTFSFTTPYSDFPAAPVIDPTTLVGYLLRYHRDTIRRLQLGSTFLYWLEGGSAPELPSLRDFTALEELKIHGPSIPAPQNNDDALAVQDGNAAPQGGDGGGDESPPPVECPLISLLSATLRHLHVMYAGQPQVDQLVALAGDARQQHPRLPNLRRVTVTSYLPPVAGPHGEQCGGGLGGSMLGQADWDKLRSAFGKAGIAFVARTSDQSTWDIGEF